MPEGNTISSSLLAKILSGIYGGDYVSFAIFLKDYVIEGAEYTATPGNPKRFTIGPSIIALADDLYRTSEPKSFQTNAPNTIYYVDYVAGKGYRFNVDHPLETHLMLWRIQTTASGAISTVTDLRGVIGGVQFDDNISIIPDLIVNTTNIVNNAVTTTKIADGSITTPKLADEAVVTAKIGNNAVTTLKLGDQSVTTAKIANTSVDSAKIADGSIIPIKLADNAVTSAKINNNAVTTIKIGDAAVTSAKLNANSVDNTKIADGAVSTNKIQAGSITTDRINNLAITSGKLADGSVVETKIGTGAVTSVKIGSNAITTPKINAEAVTVPKLAADVIALINSAAGAARLSDLQDVDIITRADGRVLSWDASSSKYVFVDQTGGGGPVVTNFKIGSKVFTATGNQTVFSISDVGSYEIGKHYLRVWVDGVIQLVTTNFLETNTTTFTLTTGATAGAQVFAEWFEGVGTGGGGGGGATNLSDLQDVNSAAKADGRVLQWNAASGKHVYASPTSAPAAHASTHLTGGSDAIPVAVAGTSSGLMSAAQAQSLVNVIADVDDLSDLPGQVSTLSSSVSGVQATVTSLDSNVSTLSTDVGTLSTSVGNLSSQVGTLSTNVSGLSTSVSTLSGDVTTVSGKVSVMEPKVNTLVTDMATVKSNIGTVSTLVTNSKVLVGAVNELSSRMLITPTNTQTYYRVGPGKTYSTIQSAVDAIPKFFSGQVVVEVDPGTYTGDVFLIGFHGYRFDLRPSGAGGLGSIKIDGSVQTVSCYAEIQISGVQFTTNQGIFHFSGCSNAHLTSCSKTVSGTLSPVYVLYSTLSVSQSTFSNQGWAFYLGNSRVMVDGTSGTGNTANFRAGSGSIVHVDAYTKSNLVASGADVIDPGSRVFKD